jgi:heavy metal sensor kinase
MSSDLEKQLAIDSAHDIQEVLHVFTEGPLEKQLEEMPEESREFKLQIKIMAPNGKTLYITPGIDERDWPVDSHELQEALKKPFWSNKEFNDQSYLVLTQSFKPINRPEHFIQIANSRNDINRIKNQLIYCINIGTPIILIVVLLVGRIFSKKALEPVELIRMRAQTITTDNLHERLVYDGPPDELFRLTATLNDLLERIQKTISQMKRFVADASHELRIPLAGLRGIVEVALRKNRTNEEYKQTLETVHNESERLSELIWDLLSLARADAGEIKLEKVNVDVEEFFRDVFDQAEALNAEKKVTIQHGDIPQGKVQFDEAKIHQLIINLIENAIHYNKPGGKVIISGELTQNSFVVLVKDTGIGIGPEDQTKIFDRFYRVDKARSRDAGGTGLGLSIARTLAEAHNGTLTVKSIINEGSEFRLTLPLG